MDGTADKVLAAAKGRRILVIGDAMLDAYVWGDASRLSPEAPVPVVRVDRETAVPGGAANVAANLAALGAEVELFAPVGTDSGGARLAETLASLGVRLCPGSASDKRPTIVKTRVVCRRQQICRLDREAPPSAYALTEEELRTGVAPAAARADAIVLSDYAKGLLDNASLRAILALEKRPRLVALDPKPRAGMDYSGVSVMTPNRAEALRLAGVDDVPGADFPAEEVCAAIHARFSPGSLVVTLGPGGMLLSEGGRALERIPTFAREVFDVSGAGDTVIAALSLALASGSGLADAARFANEAAGVVVGKLGTAVATPDEIRARAAIRAARNEKT